MSGHGCNLNINSCSVAGVWLELNNVSCGHFPSLKLSWSTTGLDLDTRTGRWVEMVEVGDDGAMMLVIGTFSVRNLSGLSYITVTVSDSFIIKLIQVIKIVKLSQIEDGKLSRIMTCLFSEMIFDISIIINHYLKSKTPNQTFETKYQLLHY